MTPLKAESTSASASTAVAAAAQKVKLMKNLWLWKPMQLPTQGQWWSMRSTQRSHREQWCVRGGLILLHR